MPVPRKAERNAEIYQRYKSGEKSMRQLGALYGVHWTRIAEIVEDEGNRRELSTTEGLQSVGGSVS